MDDARKLLDSLMGQTRDVDLKEAKKTKGQNFKEEDVCKFHLLGFCPIDQQLFRNTKRHLGDCPKVHSNALKEEYEEHPKKEEYQARYLKDVIRYLESVVRTADEAVVRVKRNIDAANKDLEEKGPNDVAKQEIEKIRQQCNNLLKEAEELAEEGNITGSKEKQELFQETKAKADEWEQKCKVPIKEEVCEICGLRPEDGDGMRKFAHTEGKIHIGFMVCREWLTKFREQVAVLEEKREEKRGARKDRQGEKKDEKNEQSEKKDEKKEEEKDQKTEGPEVPRRDRDRNRDRDAQLDDRVEGERNRSRRDNGREYRDRDDQPGPARPRGDRGQDDRRGGKDRGEGDRRTGGDRAHNRTDRNRGGGYRERSRSRDQRRY